MKSLRLALRQPTSLYKGGRIPPACLTATHLPLQGRQNPSGLPAAIHLPLQGRQKADFKSHALFVNNNKIPEDKK